MSDERPMTFVQKRAVLIELCPDVVLIPGFADALADVFGTPLNGSLAAEKGTPCQCLFDANKVFACIDQLPEGIAAVVERHTGTITSDQYADVQAIYRAFVRAAADLRGWLESMDHHEAQGRSVN